MLRFAAHSPSQICRDLTLKVHSESILPLSASFFPSFLTLCWLFLYITYNLLKPNLFGLARSASGVSCSVHVTVGWLRSLLVLDHLVLESDKASLDRVVWFPVLEACESGGHLAGGLVDRWHVDLGSELEGGWLSWVVLAGLNEQEVDSVIHVSVWGSDDGSVPLSERLVITLRETVGDALITKLSFLCLLELLVELEGSWHCR